jgi:hypothetical protein
LDTPLVDDAIEVAQKLTIIRARNCWDPNNERRGHAEVTYQQEKEARAIEPSPKLHE